MTMRVLLAAALPLSLTLPVQALEVSSEVPSVAATALPAAPPPVGLPQLQQQVSCPALQQRIRSAVGGEAAVWSVSVADANGRLLADVNGTHPRIPALAPTTASQPASGASPMAPCRSPARVIPISIWPS
jgi:D-alanyl-D-alanine carboxypeptidase/D-alanyl-D-alanine-endopeptidase (penicillin-binding protein 4)